MTNGKIQVTPELSYVGQLTLCNSLSFFLTHNSGTTIATSSCIISEASIIPHCYLSEPQYHSVLFIIPHNHSSYFIILPALPITPHHHKVTSINPITTIIHTTHPSSPINKFQARGHDNGSVNEGKT